MLSYWPCFSTAFAKPDSINDRAVASFQKDFHKASDVSWASTSNYVMATFMMDNETQFAYYDFQGKPDRWYIIC
ncbi:MAG: hypothetical protein WDM78_12205 [Puia sp.]